MQLTFTSIGMAGQDALRLTELTVSMACCEAAEMASEWKVRYLESIGAAC